jgi:hypothetical protein
MKGKDDAAPGGDKAPSGEEKAVKGKDKPVKGKDKPVKGKDKAAKGKGKKGASDRSAAVSGVCVASHPRSASGVRRAKGLGGLLGAALAMILAHGAHLPLLDVLLRGLAGGIAGQLVLWAVAVAVARQLVIAEIRARHAEINRAVAAARASDSAG